MATNTIQLELNVVETESRASLLYIKPSQVLSYQDLQYVDNVCNMDRVATSIYSSNTSQALKKYASSGCSQCISITKSSIQEMLETAFNIAAAFFVEGVRMLVLVIGLINVVRLTNGEHVKPRWKEVHNFLLGLLKWLFMSFFCYIALFIATYTLLSASRTHFHIPVPSFIWTTLSVMTSFVLVKSVFSSLVVH
ncbi:hypothetical protein FRC02_000811 [Tulasnella sp. 418]|nr:hypothetical protein FRC02_000811 [Tulasnella sp. 418]